MIRQKNIAKRSGVNGILWNTRADAHTGALSSAIILSSDVVGVYIHRVIALAYSGSGGFADMDIRSRTSTLTLGPTTFGAAGWTSHATYGTAIANNEVHQWEPELQLNVPGDIAMIAADSGDEINWLQVRCTDNSAVGVNAWVTVYGRLLRADDI